MSKMTTSQRREKNDARPLAERAEEARSQQRDFHALDGANRVRRLCGNVAPDLIDWDKDSPIYSVEGITLGVVYSGDEVRVVYTEACAQCESWAGWRVTSLAQLGRILAEPPEWECQRCADAEKGKARGAVAS